MDIFTKYRQFFQAEGVVFVILGTVAIALPQFLTQGISIALGCVFLGAAVMQGVRLLFYHPLTAFWPSLLFFLVSLALASLLLGHPRVSFLEDAGPLFFTTLFLLFFLIDGLIKVFLSFYYRRVEKWAWLLGSGLLSLGLALAIWAGWPAVPPWEISILVGISMATYGFALLYLTI